jgi:hypothetical protein
VKGHADRSEHFGGEVLCLSPDEGRHPDEAWIPLPRINVDEAAIMGVAGLAGSAQDREMVAFDDRMNLLARVDPRKGEND